MGIAALLAYIAVDPRASLEIRPLQPQHRSDGGSLTSDSLEEIQESHRDEAPTASQVEHDDEDTDSMKEASSPELRARPKTLELAGMQ